MSDATGIRITATSTTYPVRDAGAVHFDAAQALTTAQQAQARANIDAAKDATFGGGQTVQTDYSGPEITAEDTVAGEIPAFTLYGKSTQSGTPSPSAPVPIITAGSGGSVEVRRAGKNLFGMPNSVEADGYDIVYFEDSITYNGITLTNDHRTGQITLNGQAQTVVFIRYRLPADVTGAFTLSVNNPTASSGLFVRLRNSSYQIVGQIQPSVINATVSFSDTIRWCEITVLSGAQINNFTLQPQVEFGNTATAFEPFDGMELTALPTPNGLPGIPVSSGGNYTDGDGQMWICDTIDKASGVYTQRIGQIASYAGETLPGVWMSSMDVYEPGESPTTGAHVVYALATPATINLTPAQIAALDALQSHAGSTTIYTSDPVRPDMGVGVLTGVSGNKGIVPAPNSASEYLGSDGAWHQPDIAPTAGSDKLITSAAVQAAIAALEARIEALEGGN